MQVRWTVVVGILVVGALLAVPAEAQADDEDGPTLRSITLSARTVSAGSTLVVTLDVADATGVAQVFVEIRGPEDKLRLHSIKDREPTCESGQGRTQAVLACPFQLAPTLPAGPYEVMAVQLNDVLWNTEHLEAPTELQEGPLHQLAFTVQSDNHDLEGPVAQAVEVLTPTVAAGANATLRVTASDATGLRTIGLGAVHVAGSPWISASCTVSGTSGTFDCGLAIPAAFPAGTFHLVMLTLVDVNGVATDHHRQAETAGNFGGLGMATFQVSSDSTDTSPPRLRLFQAPAVPVVRGQEYKVHVWAADETSVATAFPLFQNPYGSKQYWRRHLDVQPRDCTPWVSAELPMVCTDVVPDWFALGRVDLQVLFLQDPATNGDQWTALPGHGGKKVTQDGLNRTHFYIIPRPLGESGLPSLVALEPQVSQVLPGTVLPVTGLLDDSLAAAGNLTFAFRSAAGDVVGATGCDPRARPEAIGFLCGLILPPGTPVGRYVLDEVVLTLPDGTVADVALPAAPPSFEVLADPVADEGAPLPAGWTEYVSGTFTTARFNSGPGLAPLRAVAATDGDGGGSSTPTVVPGKDGWVVVESGDGSDGGPTDAATDLGDTGSADDRAEGADDGVDGDADDGSGDGALVPAPTRDAPAPAAAAVAVALLALALARTWPRQRR